MAWTQTSRNDLGRRAVFLLILGIALIVPSLVWPGHTQYYSYRALAIEVAAIGLLLIMGLRGGWSWEGTRKFFRTGPNLAILLFIAWSVITYLDSPFKGHGLQLLLQLAGGAVVYFAVVYLLPSRRPLQKLIGGVTAAVALAVILACVFYGQGGHGLAGPFVNSQLFAGFLVVLLPLVVVASQAEDSAIRRSLAQFATVLGIGALLITFNRSAWIGAAVGLVVLTVLASRFLGGERSLIRQKHQILLPGLLLAGAVALFFVMSGISPEVQTRVATATQTEHTSSTGWRLDMWEAGGEMVRTRPVEGWGIGSYPYFAGYLGAPATSSLVGKAPSLSDNAHNFYLQTMAETGFVGIALYLAILIGFFVRCGRVLRQETSKTRKWILVGAMAAIAAQMVHAFASPAWQFADVQVFFWLVLGIGVAASRPRAERELEAPAAAPAPARARPLPRRLGWVMAQAAMLAGAIFLTSQAWAIHEGGAIGGATGGTGSGVGAAIHDPCYNPDTLSCELIVNGPTLLRPGDCVTVTVIANFGPSPTCPVPPGPIDVTAQSTIIATPADCVDVFGNQICIRDPYPNRCPGRIRITAEFTIDGETFVCEEDLVTLRIRGRRGGRDGDDGGGGAGIIIGAIAGAGLLFFLLGRRKKKDHDDDDKGDDEGDYKEEGGGGAYVAVPSGAKIGSIRTEPERLAVNPGEEANVRVFVQFQQDPKWYEVTDHPDTDFKIENGQAQLVGSSATQDRYMVTRHQLKSEGLKIVASFRDASASVPVEFQAP